MFRTRGFIFRKTVLCADMVPYVLHASLSAVKQVEECVQYSSTY